MSNVVKLDRGQPAWWASCLQNKDGRPISGFRNAVIALEQAPEFIGMLCFDEMARDVVICTPDAGTRSPPHFLSNNDISILQFQLQGLGLRTLGRDNVAEAIEMVARQYPVHELRDWLESLQWDGLPRLDSWLADCLGAERNPYHAGIGRMFLISMVARVLEPGCKADYMLVLEGPQGTLKSTACRVLAGAKYFNDHFPELAHAGKDISIHLGGKWLIEVAEMHAFSKADTSLLKSFLSRTEETYRPVYARREVREPRQCVFIGTNNQETYLRDETGGRRFWPVKCGEINIDRLESIRDQLFAEAVNACIANEPRYPDRAFELQFIKPEQDARYEEDPWQPLIEEYLDTTMTPDIRLENIALMALEIPRHQYTPLHQRRITNVLRRLGWVKKHTKKGNSWLRDTAKGEG